MSQLDWKVWRLWCNTFGFQGAFGYAMGQGHSSDEIHAANKAWGDDVARRLAEDAELQEKGGL